MQPITPVHYLVLSAALLLIGTVGVLTNLALTGTYIVRADGRGTATLTPTGSNSVNLEVTPLPPTITTSG